MDRIKVMVNGIPGNVAVNLFRHINADNRFELLHYSLTGPEITDTEYRCDDSTIRLLQPDLRDGFMPGILKTAGSFISVDFTHPSAVNANAEFYSRWNLPFVMGTTGGDRDHLEAVVRNSELSAVIAPNMAKQIVAFQAMIDFAARSFPELFKGYSLQVRESHQKGKADTSGTARAVVSSFQQLGIDFSMADIDQERDPETQKSEWGIPEEYLTGHAWHTYTLTSEDRTTKFEFTHNVNGRDIYARGTMDAIEYLHHQLQKNDRGTVFTMMDVLRGI